VWRQDWPAAAETGRVARMTVMMFKMATVMVATSIKAIAVNHRAARLLSSLVTPNRE